MASPLAVYRGPGFQLQHPDDWLVEETDNGSEATVTLRPEDDSTALWSLSILRECPEPRDTLAAVIDAFAEEYDDIETDDQTQQIAGRDAIGTDIEFVCLELTNTAVLRIFQSPAFTAMLWVQATDHEWDDLHTELDAITASIQLT
ncbi:MAG: hypothetical protein R3B90_00405 [Planctomycetaceae bacterium]